MTEMESPTTRTVPGSTSGMAGGSGFGGNSGAEGFSPMRAVLGGGFLAASWTWCIGMFLPVYLLRDYGVPGLLAFAVPNVIGAMAFAFFFPTPESSRRFVARCAPAMRLFSFVTLAFQWFFAVWLAYSSGIMGGRAIIGVGGFALMAILVLIPLASWSNIKRVSGLSGVYTVASTATLISILLALAWIGHDSSVLDIARRIKDVGPPKFTLSDAMSLVPACVLGFLCSPLLDPTFHRVRQDLPGATGTMAFVGGFGILFSMILGITLLYAPLVLKDAGMGLPGPSSLPAFLVFHVAIQLAITITLHERSWPTGATLSQGVSVGSSRDPLRMDDPPISGAGTGAMLLGVVLYFCTMLVAIRTPLGLNSERMYMGFLSFFAVFVPAFVIASLVNPRAQVSHRVGLALLTGAAAGYFYYDGFILKEPDSLIYGSAIVLLMPGLVGLALPRVPTPLERV